MSLNVAGPLVVVMAPTCKPFGPRAAMIRSLTPDEWLEAYDQSAPHGRFCGHVAKRQIVDGLFFPNEQPRPSDLYYDAP